MPCAEANPDGHCKCYSKAKVKKPDIKIPFLVRLKQMGRHNEGCSNCLNYVREETDTIKFTTATMTANDTCKKFMHNCRKNTITKFAPIQGELVQYTSNCEINNFSGDCPWFKSSSNKGFLFKIRVKLYKWALANYQRWS
jgi:hypothetical protein